MDSLLDTLHHFFVPHEGNNHRARALHFDALIVYILMFALFNLSLRVVHRTYPDILGFATNIHAEQLLAETNAKRQEAGLEPLSINPQLSAAAAGKAADMFAKGYWAHIAPEGTTPWDFIVGAGYNYTLAGENLAKNFQNSSDVVSAWMASPTHRDNILKSGYREIGFAVVDGVLNGEETTLVVQMFGSQPGTQVAAAPQEADVAPAAAPQVDVVPVEEIVAEEVIEIEEELAAIPAGFERQPNPYQNAEVGGQYIQTLPDAFTRSQKTPLIDISRLTRDIALLFGGMFVGVLMLDAWVVARKQITRVAGHNIGHIAFMIAIMIAIGSMFHGSIL